jgi:uncharacterized repeat protein (TIGR01451 family)
LSNYGLFNNLFTTIIMKKNLLGIVFMLSGLISFAQDTASLRVMELIQKNKQLLGLSKVDLENMRVSNAYYDRSTDLYLAYIQQTHQSLPIFNQLLILAFRQEELVSKTGTFIEEPSTKLNSPTALPRITAATAVLNALRDRKLPAEQEPLVIASEQNGNLITFEKGNYSREPITAELMWVPVNDDKRLHLCWQVYIIPPSSSDYWLIRIDAVTGQTIDVSNLTVYCNFGPGGDHSTHHHESSNTTETDESITSNTLSHRPTAISSAYYKVVPFPAESPIHPGGTPSVVQNPWEMIRGNATTLKWHSTGSTEYSITRGNNVWAQEDVNGNNGTGIAPRSTTSGDTLTFNFTHNFSAPPTQSTPVQNQSFNTTNLFYWNNLVHDITYQYGFDEPAGNFQSNNLGRGGAGNDFVYADAQDGSGDNNANFATPGDGENGRMQMYLWSGNPQKDGSVDNGIICHEFAHGISNRLTGGPSQAACLQNAEQMGEGWSDYYALMYTQNWATSNLNTGFNTPRGIGNYANSQSVAGSGIRTQRYCTNFAVNSRTFSSNLPGNGLHHSRGEIWCAALWDMTWNIINQVGRINPNIYDVAGGGGNVIALRLVTQGMKLQPCSPGFMDARDAILRADELLYNGAHKCAIWEAFRRRGMGMRARQGSSNSVTDQASDFTITGEPGLTIQQDRGFATEGDTIRFTTTVSTTNCAAISNNTLVDTLPSNVTYISGGTYNSANRTVSFPVNLISGQSQDYSFLVKVNNGAYFPTVTLFEDSANGPSTTPIWTRNSTTGVNWNVSGTRRYSPSSSYFSSSSSSLSDHNITLTNAVSLGSTPPMLSFRHWFESEESLDGGVLEISTNNGNTWTDIQPFITEGGYTATMSPGSPLPNRRAWTGSSNNRFFRTKIDLSSFANQNIKLRFRYLTNNSRSTEGWYVDDIAIKDQALVEIKSQLFNNATLRMMVDTFTVITEPIRCSSAVVTADPTNTLACKNSSIQLQATASGTEVRYQWQISTNGGSSFSNLPNDTTATLTLNNVQSILNNNRYRLIAFNDCPSSDTSTPATLQVSDSLFLNRQPSPQTVCAGSNSQFAGSANGDLIGYQWEYSSNNGQTYQQILGATNGFIPLNNISDSLDGRLYRLKFIGCNILYTNPVQLTVNRPARIDVQPNDINACPASTALFTGGFSGTNLQYLWQVSSNDGVTFSDIPNSNNDTLTLQNVTSPLNNNLYRVKINSNECPGEQISNAVRLLISTNALFTRQPEATNICAGSSALLSVGAIGSGLQYQWEQSTDNGNTFSAISGTNDDTLNLSNTTMTQNGYQYRVVVTSVCSSTGIASNAVSLSTFPPLVFNQQPESVVRCLNSDATFTATVTGNPTGFQWQVSTDNGNSYTNIDGQTGLSLTLNNISSQQNTNRYRLNGNTTVCPDAQSDAAILTVSMPAEITHQASDSVTACEASTVSLVVDASSNTPLTYQWQERSNANSSFVEISGETSSILTLSNVSNGQNNREYRVAVTAENCNAVNSDSIKLIVNPLANIQLSATPGNRLLPNESISLNAISNPPLTVFSWYKDNQQIDGESGPTLQVTESGTYYAAGTDSNSCTAKSADIVILDSTVSQISVYPNPNKGSFKVRVDDFGNGNANRQLLVFDGKGSRVFSKRYGVSSNQLIDVQLNVPRGIYLIVLTDETGKIKLNEKVVIQ